MSFTPLENVAGENCVGKRKIKLNFSAQKKKEKKKAIKCAIAMKKSATVNGTQKTLLFTICRCCSSSSSGALAKYWIQFKAQEAFINLRQLWAQGAVERHCGTEWGNRWKKELKSDYGHAPNSLTSPCHPIPKPLFSAVAFSSAHSFIPFDCSRVRVRCKRGEIVNCQRN